ncbi:MAG TPA: PAAR domain-containing protein [Pyrinomonadaceae bacterium]|jgi:uncharacterized Zn-binding protein involved in type VI secretion|nr:PAAR domain-containing protein [Pyrinomonadaceae bacterium]
MPSAAHIGHQVTHTEAKKGLFGGLVAGALVGVAVVATVTTGGLAAAGAAAIISATATGASLGGMIGKWIGGKRTVRTGPILEGSGDVRINRNWAAFCTSLVSCNKHSDSEHVAQGSAKVRINGHPAARIGDMGTCGFKVGEGSPNVNIGGGTVACMKVGSELPGWTDYALMALGLAGGGFALAAQRLGMLAISARLGGSLVGGYGGTHGGSWLGGKIFGEGSTGQTVMGFGGSLVGAALGFRGGARLVPGGRAPAAVQIPRERLPQDVAVNPRPPKPLGLDRPVGLSAKQNAAVRADIEAALAEGARDIRVNQQQVNAAGQRVGINRPDLQYTDANGRRVYIEYDRSTSARGLPHKERILSNDPQGEVILREVD